ncbi:MAG: TRAP transporter small permease subunit [Syntrophobacteraceae bacterium]
MRGLSRVIDKIVSWQAEGSGHLMTLLAVLMCVEVILRYVFKTPTVWGLEFTTFLFGMHFLLGYSYTELHHGHVNVTIFTLFLPKKVQAYLYLISTSIISLPLCTLLALWGWDNAMESTRTLERSPSAWNPPIWPMKLIMAIGFTLLAMQVLSNIIKAFAALSEEKTELGEVR